MNNNGNATFKIITGFVIGLMLIIGGAIFYASQKVKPEQIRQLTISLLEKQFPNAKVELGKVDYSLGTSLTFSLHDLEMSLKQGEKLAVVKEAQLKVPVIAVLTNGGTITLNIDSPAIALIEKKKELNWQRAMGKKMVSKSSSQAPSKADAKANDKAQKQKTELPSFINRSKINVKFSNTKVNYSLGKSGEGEILVDKVILKNINLASSSAYEIASKIKLKLATNDELSLGLMIIGQIDLKKFVETGILQTSLIVNIDDLLYPSILAQELSAKIDLDVIVQKDGKVDLKTKFSSPSILEMNGEFSILEGVTTGKNLNLKVFMNKLVAAFAPKLIGQNLENVDLANSELEVSGGVKIDNKGRITPNMKFSLSPNINLNHVADIPIALTLNGSLSGQKSELNIIKKLLEGQINTNVKTKLDLSNPGKIHPVTTSIKVNNLVLPKRTIRESLYGTKTEGADEVKESSTDQSSANTNKKITKAPAPNLPQVKLSLALNNLKIGDEYLNGSIPVLVKGNKISSSKINLKYSKGIANSSFTTRLLTNHRSATDFKFKLSNLNMSALKMFLPENLDAVSGEFSGNVSGKVGTGASLTHDIKAQVIAKDGELKGFNLAEHVYGLVEGLSFLKGKIKKKELKVSDKFEKFEFKGRLEHNHYAINKFHFSGLRKMIIADGAGNLFPQGGKTGVFDLNVEDQSGKVSTHLQKYAGTKILPMRLKGVGMVLKPDYAYTLKKLTKKAAKSKTKKAVKKLKKKILNEKTQKKLEKIIPKEKLNKVFKGLF